ncbi:MAG: hypothetical protein RL139_873 [Gemmatimonadota bacterium]|jgi:[ribosomal protein S5]-alanine N-acetyltransferase
MWYAPRMRPVPPPFAEPLPSLQTARLLLRALERTDAAAVHEAVAVAEVAQQTLAIPHPYPAGAADGFIADAAAAWQAGTAATWAVVHRAEDRLVGMISLRFVWPHRRAELGYWIARPAWGNGYATEAARAVIAHAFDALGLHRVEARRFDGNAASGRVLAKAGLRDEGCLRGALWRDGVARDVIISGILAGDPR